MFLSRKKTQMIDSAEALPGRADPITPTEPHFITKRPLDGAVPEGMEQAMFGMGCFWGVERMFWGIPGVWVSMVGYAAGHTPNPSYDEVCTGRTGHNEVVRVIFDPTKVSYDALLKTFWEGHDPTQGMRQGNDIGTQYRSGIYVYTDDQRDAAKASREMFDTHLKAAGYDEATTEIIAAPTFYFAEGYHQQYLAKNPNGYCGIGGTGVTCPIGTGI